MEEACGGIQKPADRLASSRLMMALSKATMVVIDTFSTQDMASLMEHMKTVAIMGQCRPFLMVCLVKVVSFKQDIDNLLGGGWPAEFEGKLI